MTLNAIWRLIRTLLVALGAPACMVARLWRRDARMMRAIARMLGSMRTRGLWLRYDGEDEAMAARRLDRLAWIARDPKKATRHMARALMRRGGGGFRRWLMGAQYAPVAWTPPSLAIAALTLAADVCADAPDTS